MPPPPLALWLIAATVLLGVVLAGYWLAERPVRGPARLASIAHGTLGAAGTGFALWSGGLPALMLAAALAGGAIIALAQLRRRRPPGLAVMLHATFGVAGAVLLAAALAN